MMAILESYQPPATSLTDKTVLITGGSSGIGKWNVKQFAKLKPKRLFVLGRNAAKTEDVIASARAESGFDEIQFIHCDTASIKSVQSAAEQFLAQSGGELHLLVCNAGTALFGVEPTDDGFELLWQANYLSHFLLTELLLPTLKKTAEKEGKVPGCVRVVNVSSIAHRNVVSDIDYDRSRSFPTKSPIETIKGPYGLSKFAQVVDAKSRAEELKEFGIMVYSLHPGTVATEIWEKGGVRDPESEMQIELISEERGSLTTLYVSTSSDDLVLSNSGGYFDGGQLGVVNPLVDREDIQAEIINSSMGHVMMAYFDTYTHRNFRVLHQIRNATSVAAATGQLGKLIVQNFAAKVDYGYQAHSALVGVTMFVLISSGSFQPPCLEQYKRDIDAANPQASNSSLHFHPDGSGKAEKHVKYLFLFQADYAETLEGFGLPAGGCVHLLAVRRLASQGWLFTDSKDLEAVREHDAENIVKQFVK
ncbi:hypothetical protein BJ742DRAFT_857722 [Cladochytrium replicatum]|nr:hypothetical protein BJ742DRAFT_857722 [Cladochytrium replicatum]